MISILLFKDRGLHSVIERALDGSDEILILSLALESQRLYLCFWFNLCKVLFLWPLKSFKSLFRVTPSLQLFDPAANFRITWTIPPWSLRFAIADKTIDLSE